MRQRNRLSPDEILPAPVPPAITVEITPMSLEMADVNGFAWRVWKTVDVNPLQKGRAMIAGNFPYADAEEARQAFLKFKNDIAQAELK